MRLRSWLLYLFLISILWLGVPSNAVAQGDPSMVGRWSSVPNFPFFPVHVHVLPTGKVMIWPGDISGQLLGLRERPTPVGSSNSNDDFFN